MKRVWQALGKFFRKENLMPDLEDVLVFGGLGLACYGVAQIAGGPAACIVGGTTLVWLGVKRP